MKFALVIPDGCADEPQESLGGQTPLQYAKVPAMDEVARRGIVGLADHVPKELPSGSDVGTMSLFGYDPLRFHTGRAPIEAAAQNIELADDDWAVRCNLVAIEQGRMVSFTADQIPNPLAHELIQLMQREFCGDERWKFHAGVSYRNLLIHRTRGGAAPFATDTQSTPPHDITEQLIEPHLPHGQGASELRAIMDRSRELFAENEANRRRRSEDGLSATQVWLWGLGRRPSLTRFADRFGVQSAIITAVDLLRGLGNLLGWNLIHVPGATGYTDTDYAAKGAAAVEALQHHDFVVVHVEATDEASHEGDAEAKVTALEAIDENIVGPLHDALQSDDYRLLVCPDHPTLLRTKTHSHGFVPFAMCGTGIEADEAQTYNEVTGGESGLKFLKGCDLMPFLIKGDGA